MRRYRSYKPFSVRKAERRSAQKLFFSLILAGVCVYLLLFWVLPYLIGGISIINKFKNPSVKKEVAAPDPSIAPPVLNIPFEATNTATIRFKGYTQPSFEVEIFVDDLAQISVKAKEDGNFIVEELELTLGTNKIYGKSVDLEGKASLNSKPIIILYDRDNPKLELSSPSDNQEFKGERRIIISGIIDPEDETLVYINSRQTAVSVDGKFSQTVELADGENQIQVEAKDLAGNSTILNRKVTYSQN